MKRCIKCGFVDWCPEDKCPDCGTKYNQTSTCNPLSGHRDDSGRHNTQSPVGDGNYHFESARSIDD